MNTTTAQRALDGNMILKVEIGKDNPILRSIAKPAPDALLIKDLIHDMHQTLWHYNGLGLAAPQIGRSLQLFVTNVDNKERTFVNPIIVSRSPSTSFMVEGCLSLPDTEASVRRNNSVWVTYWDQTGVVHMRERFDGMLARVIQHEEDHLRGVMIVDK